MYTAVTVSDIIYNAWNMDGISVVSVNYNYMYVVRCYDF